MANMGLAPSSQPMSSPQYGSGSMGHNMYMHPHMHPHGAPMHHYHGHHHPCMPPMPPMCTCMHSVPPHHQPMMSPYAPTPYAAHQHQQPYSGYGMPPQGPHMHQPGFYQPPHMGMHGGAHLLHDDSVAHDDSQMENDREGSVFDEVSSVASQKVRNTGEQYEVDENESTQKNLINLNVQGEVNSNMLLKSGPGVPQHPYNMQSHNQQALFNSKNLKHPTEMRRSCSKKRSRSRVGREVPVDENTPVANPSHHYLVHTPNSQRTTS